MTEEAETTAMPADTTVPEPAPQAAKETLQEEAPARRSGDDELQEGAASGVEADEPVQAPAKTDAEFEAELKAFFAELRDVDRENEVLRICWAFKLNPFEKLNLPFDATVQDINRQYRKLSLLVHPDKCSHERAQEAFEILGDAHKQLTNDEEREQLMKAFEAAKKEVLKDRKKATKHDSALRVAGMLHEKGRAGVEAEWEATEEFHQKWKTKVRDILARTEWRRRKVTERLKAEGERAEKEEKEGQELRKRKKNHEKEWESGREERVGGWRNFQQQKKKSKKAMGELKPPKMKTNDSDQLFVQRTLVQQFRGPAMKGPPPT